MKSLNLRFPNHVELKAHYTNDARTTQIYGETTNSPVEDVFGTPAIYSTKRII